MGELFTSAGFFVEKNEYILRETVNKKEGLCVARVFVQAKFVKPSNNTDTNDKDKCSIESCADSVKPSNNTDTNDKDTCSTESCADSVNVEKMSNIKQNCGRTDDNSESNTITQTTNLGNLPNSRDRSGSSS